MILVVTTGMALSKLAVYVAMVIGTWVGVANFMTNLIYACDQFVVFHVDCISQKVLPWRLLLKLSSNVIFVLIGRLLTFLTTEYMCLWEGLCSSHEVLTKINTALQLNVRLLHKHKNKQQ